MGAVTVNFSMSLDGVVSDLGMLEAPEIVAGTRVTRLRHRARH